MNGQTRVNGTNYRPCCDDTVVCLCGEPLWLGFALIGISAPEMAGLHVGHNVSNVCVRGQGNVDRPIWRKNGHSVSRLNTSSDEGIRKILHALRTAEETAQLHTRAIRQPAYRAKRQGGLSCIPGTDRTHLLP